MIVGSMSTTFAQSYTGFVPDAAREEVLFFSMLQDVPLMPGLEELEEHGTSFDKPEGRIAEAIAMMHDLTQKQVIDFYQLTLPQFGWGKVSQNSFFREKELLSIGFEENNNIKLVKITIKPVL